MLLHCERGETDSALMAVTASWLSPETLASLAELNELCLGLLAEQGQARGASAPGLLRQFHELWRVLDAPGRTRAAACPYLLLDVGFAEATRWRLPGAPHVGDGEGGPYASFFTVPAAAEVARLIFTYGWHLASAQPAAARLVLGMNSPTARLIAAHSLRQIQALAGAHPQWLRPRWPLRVEVWRELLREAAVGEGAALERVRLRGVMLLAGEVRRASERQRAGLLP
jgi:hypothetical protein